MTLVRLGLVVGLMLPAPAVLAQSSGWQGPRTGPHGRYARPPEQCIKLCEQDLNPCDPIGFKRTDGRCNPSGTGDPGGGGGGRS